MELRWSKSKILAYFLLFLGVNWVVTHFAREEKLREIRELDLEIEGLTKIYDATVRYRGLYDNLVAAHHRTVQDICIENCENNNSSHDTSDTETENPKPLDWFSWLFAYLKYIKEKICDNSTYCWL